MCGCSIGKIVPQPGGKALAHLTKLHGFLPGFFKATTLGRLPSKAFIQRSSWSCLIPPSVGSRWEIKSNRCIFITELIEGRQKQSDPSSRKGVILKWWDSMVLERWSGKGKQVLCNSDQTREEVRKFFRIHGTTIWYPLDTKHFCPIDRAKCRQELGLAENRPVGLFVGSTQPQKGFTIISFPYSFFPPDSMGFSASRGNRDRSRFE